VGSASQCWWRRFVVVLVALGALLLLPRAAAAGPLDGKGMWIWYVSKSGGSAAAIAKKAKRHRIHTVFVKSSDGTNSWSQFSHRLVKGLHRRGVRICGWQFVYGTHAKGEARAGARAVAKGADCLVIDAEATYEGRYRAADHYIRALRRRIGSKFPLALASFPYVDYHPSFPYSVFLGKGGAKFNVPQMYWHSIGTTVRRAFSHTYRWNRPYSRPILPLGQTYSNPPLRQLTEFRRRAAARRARGVSWWSWQETNRREWRAVGGRIGSPGKRPPNRWPKLRQGSKGDVVVQLQMLLQAAGRHLRVDGKFGRHTAHAVRRFQGDHGLKRTGSVGNGTWGKLRRFGPVRHRWWHPGGSHKRGAVGASAPASASLPTARYEIPPPAARR
jgi:Putative peptidoglycan binding domain